MKKILIILPIIILNFSLLSCNDKSLKISELDLLDFNQASILKNDIKKTLLISGFDTALYKKNDTIEIIEYNRSGKIKNVWRKSFMYSIYEEYEYDSLNLEKQKIFFTDFKAIFNFRYEFDSDSLILYKYYTTPSIGISKQDILKPAAIFKFKNHGKIKESSQFQNNDHGKGKKRITKYNYDTKLNILSTKEILYEPNDNDDSSLSSNAITDYYYSNKKLDSTLTTISWIDRENQKQSYTRKVVYNQKGLALKAITMDSLIIYYRHIK
ncbi:hypothetical protein HNV08_02045 [Winogradskyella eckloniae]|uniref:hypothetical protein n=1 Tax=Winogradskyella eckloniae TaxID=1089306 RepID=UPI001565620E|nr:hypothetical protein [Winogradskyella eckloniae]NRD18815.1 hypothetical protein [Winogradskyella eckloniae]